MKRETKVPAAEVNHVARCWQPQFTLDFLGLEETDPQTLLGHTAFTGFHAAMIWALPTDDNDSVTDWPLALAVRQRSGVTVD